MLLDFSKIVLKSLNYTQDDSNSCVWPRSLTGAGCFSNYLCYLRSVFDPGKRLAESILRNDNGYFVNEMDSRLGYNSEFQFMCMIFVYVR